MPTLYENVTGRLSVQCVNRTNTTANGTSVPLLGSDGGSLLIIAGGITDGSHAVTLEESDTGTGGWTAIPAARVEGGALPTLTSAGANTVQNRGFNAVKGFVRGVVTVTGATTGGAVGVVILYSGEYFPVAHS